ncbi:H/ACA ribonucleoprotein complex non-core subunit NAF1-like isoform X1 [Lolium rigidum]|uniref:H/ACA ribonucleoprotein complex non-core subunit NAF1-like isoform X1 n=1 Tax=Lolium rigidum TaxID=89674 RepID=UPI001F5D65E3|nr:H/ACA ribonucleoprotein complex non-core subunit NAF1-like isoform X1 [Lolium rigidum]
MGPIGAVVPVPEDDGGLGVDPVKELEVAAEKGGLLGLFDAPLGVELEVKKEAVMLSGGLGGDLGPDYDLPVLGNSDSAAKGDTLEGEIDAQMGTLAPVDSEMGTLAAADAEMSSAATVGAEISTVASVDAEMSTVTPARADTSTVAHVVADTTTIPAVDAEMSSGASLNEEVGRAGGKGEVESKDKVLEISDDEESSEASSSSDEESSEASSSSDEEEPVAKKHGGVIDLEAIMEEGELMAEADDDDEDETPKGPAKSKHVVEVLPPVPKIEVQLEPHHKPLPVGAISAIMGERVVVEGSVEHSPLTEGSILWITESRTPLGIVDDIFGPVKNPYYLVRYNSVEEVPGGISAGTTISFVAEFADHILNMKELYAKGYDESADHDEEADEPEFSDDEAEAEYKRSLRLAKRQTDRQLESKKPSGDKKRGQARNAGFRNDMPPRIHDTPTRGHQSQRRFERSNMAPAVADSPTHRSGSQNFSMSTPSRDMPPRIHDAPRPDHLSHYHFHRSDMAPTGADSMTRPPGPQNFPMSAPTMLPPISMNHSMPSAVQLANQMGSCFINPSQQFSHQQPNMVWPGGLPHPPQPNMGVDGAALAANIMQNILIGASQYQQYLQNQNFGGFPNGMPMAPPQFMAGNGMPGNQMPFGGQPRNHPFGLASQLPMGQGNFGQLPHMTGDQGPPAGFPNAQGFGCFPPPHEDGGDQAPGFPNMQGYGHMPSPHGDGGQPPMQFNSLPSPQGDGANGVQPPMQFNSGQFNQGSSSFRGRRPQQRGGRHSPGRGGGAGGGRHRR